MFRNSQKHAVGATTPGIRSGQMRSGSFFQSFVFVHVLLLDHIRQSVLGGGAAVTIA
jgi:hypothetical protein